MLLQQPFTLARFQLPSSSRYNSNMPNRYKEIFNLTLATIVGIIIGLTQDNLVLGAVVGIGVGIVLSLLNKPNGD